MTENSTPKGPHCENCGSTDAEDLYHGDQGYTACCNECVCYGDSRRWTNDSGKVVRACCTHTADALMNPPGSEWASYWLADR